MSSAIRAVVFDMDGLMIDTEPLYKSAWQQTCALLGFDLDDQWYEGLIGLPTQECEALLMARFGTAFPLAEFRNLWLRLWDALAKNGGIRVKPGLFPLLSFLGEAGIARAVATSSTADFAEFSLASAGLGQMFAKVVTRDQVTHGKPAPDLYLEAARRLGQDPVHCVALEDSDAGVLSATSAGMLTICVPDLKPPSIAAAKAAYRVVGSLHEARELIAALTLR